MANVVGSATIRIIPDTSGFSAALRGQLNSITSQISSMGSRNITGNLSNQLNALGASLDRTGTRAALVGQAFTYGLTRPLIQAGQAIIGVAADFDEAARTVAAVTIPDPIEGVFESMDMFEKRVDEYKDSARKMARETVFSSTEIEKAYVDLARAGLTTADQLESVIGTVANIALVEGGEMADFSDKLVQIFTGFGGNFEEIGEQYTTIFGDVRATTADLVAEFEQMGDVITLTSQRTVTDITDLAVAFRYAGPTAKAAGLSFEETAAGLGMLAQAGFSASMGGTALRGIITRLAIPTKLSQEIFDKFGLSMEQAFQPEHAAHLQDALNSMGMTQEEIDEIMTGGIQGFREAQNAISAYGFEVFDATGKMRPLVDVIQDFVDKGARVGDVGKVFGQRAGPAFQGLMDNLPALKRLTVELDGAEGALDRMAERMKTSASVQFKLLKNSLTELAIAFGESGVLSFFADMAADLRDFALGLADTNPQILKIAGVLAALVAAIGPLTLIMGLWVRSTGQFLKVLAFAFTPLGAFAFAIGAIAVAFGALVAKSEPLRNSLSALFDAIMRVVGPLKDVFSAVFGPAAESALSGLNRLGLQLAMFFNDLAISINKWIAGGGLRDLIISIIDKIEAFKEAWRTVVDLFNRAKPAIIQAFTEIGETVEAAFKLIVTIVGEVWDGLWALGEVVLPVVAVAFKAAWEAAGIFVDALEFLFTVLKPVASIINDVLGPALLALVQIFLVAHMAGFRFLEWFTAARAAAPAAAGSIHTFTIGVIGAFRAMFGYIQGTPGTGILSGLSTSIGNALAGIIDAVARVVRPFTNALGGIIDAVGRFIGALDARLRAGGISGLIMSFVVNPILAGLGMVGRAFESAASVIGGGMVHGLTAAFNFVTQAIPNLVTRLAVSLQTLLASAMSSAGGGIQALGAALSSALQQAFMSLTNLNSGAITAALDQVFSSIGINVAGIASVIGTKLNEAILRASTFISTGAAAIGTAIVNGIQSGLGALPGVWNTITTGFTSAFTAARASIAGIVIGIIANVQLSWQNLRSTLSSIDLGASIRNLAAAVINIPTLIHGLATSTQATTASMGVSFSGLWSMIHTGAVSAFTAVKNTVMAAASAIASVMEVAAQAAVGFMQGLMLAEANDLKGKLSALIPVIISIGTTMAMAMATNPVFALIAAIQALAVLAGTVFGMMKEEAVDLTNSVDGFRAALSETSEEAQKLKILKEIEKAADEIGSHTGGTGFSTLMQNMDAFGVTMKDYVDALHRGEAATDEFFARFEESFASNRIREVNGEFQVFNATGDEVVDTFDNMADARARAGEIFRDDFFAEDALRSLTEDYKNGVIGAEAFNVALQQLGLTEEEAAKATNSLEVEQKSLGQAIQDTTSFISTYRSELQAMLTGVDPARDMQQATDALITQVRNMGSALDSLDQTKNNIDWTLAPNLDLSNVSPQAIEFRSQMLALEDAFFNQAYALGISAQSADEFNLGLLGIRQNFINILMEQGATNEQAEILADHIANISGVKDMRWSTNFAEVSEQIAHMQAQTDTLMETWEQRKARVDAELIAQGKAMTEAQRTLNGVVLSPEEYAQMIVGLTSMLGGDAYAPPPGSTTVPTVQAPGGVTISPNAVAGMPSAGVPSEVTVKIIFSAIENMDAVLTQITGFTDSVKTQITEIAQGVIVLGMVVAQTAMDSIRAIVMIPSVLGAVAQMAATVLMAVAGGVSAVVMSVISGLLMIPTVTMAVVSAVSNLFSAMASGVLVATTMMVSSIIAMFGSLIQYILLAFSALNASVLQIVESIAAGFSVMANSAVVASMVIVSAITQITFALMRIPPVMAAVGQSIARGFSQPFNLIASSVWNPFASFINSAATALGLGPLLPAGLSIPVFHRGGIVGDGTRDSYDGSRSITQDEVFALLQKGEGVMSKQMMANMTTAQISAFKKGEKRWWAVGGPYESGKGQAGTRIDSGYAYNSPDIPNFEQTKAFYEGTIKPLIGSVIATHPGNLAANIGGTSMSRVGDAVVEYTRGYTDRMTEEQQKYLVQIGLPPDFDINGVLPAGFDIAEWRSFLGANKKPGSWPLIVAYLNATGVPFLINSTVRPGDVGSYHASGRAVDFGAPGDANYDSPGLLRINHALAPLLGVLAELIYSGPGGISDKAYDAATMAQHHNHVHAALRDGGIIRGLVYAMLGEDGPEVVIPLNDPQRALSLARRSGLLRTLQDAQGRSTSYSPPSAVSDARSAITGGGDDGILGGAGNTYHIHGISWEQVRRKIDNRDKAALRRRR